MAAVTLTERETFSHGNMKGEIGKFLDPDTDIEIYTKIGRIIWFRLMATGTGTDGTYDAWWNYSDAGTTIARGVVHIPDTQLSGTASYIYLALGTG
jgi:hypothetical protein